MKSWSSLAAESSNAVHMRNYWPRTASTAGFGTTKAIRRVRPTKLARTMTTTMRTRTEAVEAALPECLQHRHDKELHDKPRSSAPKGRQGNRPRSPAGVFPALGPPAQKSNKKCIQARRRDRS